MSGYRVFYNYGALKEDEIVRARSEKSARSKILRERAGAEITKVVNVSPQITLLNEIFRGAKRVYHAQQACN